MNVKSIVAYILSLVLFLALVGITILLCIKSSWLNQQFMLSKLEKNEYFTATYNTILDAYESIGIPSGIPVEVFEEGLSRDMVKQDLNKSIESLYNNQSSSAAINTDIIFWGHFHVELKESLNSAFIKYAESIAADITDDSVKEALENLEEYCIAQYTSLTQFPFAKELSPYIPKITKFINFVLIGCAVVLILCVCGLILIKRTISIRYIGSSLIGSGLACIIPCCLLLVYAPYKRINLGIEILHKFLVDFIESGVQSILISGIVIFIIGIITSVLMILAKIKKTI